MNTKKCDICKKTIKDNYIVAGFGLFNTKDFCLKCGKPISDFLKKNGFTQELKKYSKLLAKI
ncbi:hypothetical protein A3C57_00425 [Candidatus Nomurabacteria bacterium RIFCSPHIGHO2_02_FULL_33_12]|uniref:Uncharacterized protein n=1 Tax=Candidatus Nomurabacteria bacterium RIFCSPLOWO2_01_FULL_33_17 TaxID=1801764 RepID=A0A1F6WQ55_9BACT|nr:MAG: hypothetical protein A3C57_00425 [Candidatus Nomurabacteria bacterium RIFCSPHIGHO2_02_FULL_33_12]OGI83954.1 MAG: hypothetical protein A2903_02975 [Candidatus Nomurabacteria bacterium RIFCSPLOWO2_01_FULL_33_17]